MKDKFEIMKEKISFESLSHLKNRKNNHKMLIFVYSSVILSIGISSSCYSASFESSNENIMFLNIFYSIMFITSSAIIVGIWVYIFRKRFQTFEAALKGINDNFLFKLSQRGEKVNIYLRFGLTIFGISCLIYIGMRTSISFRERNGSPSFLIFGIIQAIFIIMETLFILFNHRLILLTHKKAFKICFVHLIITNILMWANGSIGKISFDFQNSEFCLKKKYDISCNLYIYFLPPVSEYAVIIAAVFYEIYTRIGKYNLMELETKEHKKCSISWNPKVILSSTIGITIVFLCIFSSVSSVFFHILEISDLWLYHFHNVEILVLNILTMIILIFAYLKTRRLKFSVSMSKNSLDKNILLVAYVFTLNFIFLAIFICGYGITSTKNVSFIPIIVVRLISAFVELVQITMQTHFLVDAFKRCSFNKEQMEKKPGRNFLIVLMAINTGMWFLCSLQIKNADVVYYKEHEIKQYIFLESKENNVIGLLVRFFLQSSLPLAMLYRYHSSACISDIYSKMYHTEVTRFEVHLRARKINNDHKIIPTTKTKELSDLPFDPLSTGRKKSLVPSEAIKNKRRTQSAGIINLNVLKEVNKLQKRRATIKNMEEAHYNLMSNELSYMMVSKKMNSKISQLKSRKKLFLPNIHRMVESGFFTTNDEMYYNEDDNGSVYSI